MYQAFCPENGCDQVFDGRTLKQARAALNGHLKVHKLNPRLHVIGRAVETRLANTAAKARGKMYLANPARDPKSAEEVILEMVLILDHAPQAFPGSRRA